MSDAPRPEFLLGSEVHPGHFFKSNFARSFLGKSLDHGFLLAEQVVLDQAQDPRTNNNNNNNGNSGGNGGCQFLSLDLELNRGRKDVWRSGEVQEDTAELERLRKQCQQLTEENRRLQSALTSSQQVPQLQVIDNVFLQSQVDTLQWQLKQTEANRQMHRSLLEQVLRFLDRARKSLDILHERSLSKDKARVPRSRSVHTVTSACNSSSNPSSTPNFNFSLGCSCNCSSKCKCKTNSGCKCNCSCNRGSILNSSSNSNSNRGSNLSSSSSSNSKRGFNLNSSSNSISNTGSNSNRGSNLNSSSNSKSTGNSNTGHSYISNGSSNTKSKSTGNSNTSHGYNSGCACGCNCSNCGPSLGCSCSCNCPNCGCSFVCNCNSSNCVCGCACSNCGCNCANSGSNSSCGSNCGSNCSNCSNTTTTWATASKSGSRFSRARSVAQISTGTIREFTWSVLRRNDPVHCTPPRSKPQESSSSSTRNIVQDGLVHYRRPKKTELDPDDVPPEKLSQEAFRLMRTVQSLLSMREPDLARVAPTDESTVATPSPVNSSQAEDEDLLVNESGLEFQFLTGSTTSTPKKCSRMSSSSGSGRTDFPRDSREPRETSHWYQTGRRGEKVPRRRTDDMVEEIMDEKMDNKMEQKVDNKMEQGTDGKMNKPDSQMGGKMDNKMDSMMENKMELVHRRADRVPRRRIDDKMLADQKIEASADQKMDTNMDQRMNDKMDGKMEQRMDKMENKTEQRMDKMENKMELTHTKPRSAISVSSAEDESGFSSMNSFQEVGLPSPPSPMKGCHTEIGLPVVPLDRIRNRRWSSTPAEFRALLRQSRGFPGSESLSVWV